MSRKILFVDDDKRILSAFQRRLRRNFDFHVAEGAQEALKVVEKEGPFAVVISDMQMPGMNGVEFLKHVMAHDPLTIRVMLTGNADRETAVASVNDSAVFRYLNKPCAAEVIAETIEAALVEYDSALAEKKLLEGTLAGSVKVLVDILAANDPGSFKQLATMRRAGQQLGKFLNLKKAWTLDMAIMLSTIGQVMLPPELRAKIATGQQLNDVEQDLVTRSPEVARKLLLNIPRMSEVAESIYYRDRAYDGTGFPGNEVKGDDIPLNARILFLLHHMLAASDEGWPGEQTFSKLDETPHLFDPNLVKMARACFLETTGDTETKPIRRDVQVAALLPGDQTVNDVKTVSGEMVLSAGHEFTDAVIERIRQFHKMRPLVEPICVLRIVKASEEQQDDNKDAA